MQTKNNLERAKERWEVKKVEEVSDGEEGEVKVKLKVKVEVWRKEVERRRMV